MKNQLSIPLMALVLLLGATSCYETSSESPDKSIDVDPMTFTITNNRPHAVFMLLTPDTYCGGGQPHFQKKTESCWTDISFFETSDMVFCSEEENCCDCQNENLPSLTAIAPGESVSLLWDGLALKKHKKNSSFCYEEIPLQAGTYRMLVWAYDDYGGSDWFELPENPYAPKQEITTTRKIVGVEGKGNYEAYGVEFDLPSQDDNVVLIVD